MFGVSGQELFIIVILALVILGPKKLPEVARTIGRGYKDLKKAVDGIKGTVNVNEVFSEMMKDEPESTPKKKEEGAPSKQDDDHVLRG